MVGWLTQNEEEFKRKCDAVCVDMNSKAKKSNHFYVSKALSTFLRHSIKKTHLFNALGTVDLGTTFAELDRNNPVRH